MYPPKFISFEGGDGAGKSTQVKLLHQAFTNAGLKSITTREPGGTEGAESIRNLLVNGDVNKWDAQTELLLHLAARFDHVNKLIKPALASGTYVICDRFTDSTIAYQAYGHGLGRTFVQNICTSVLGNFTTHLTIILDIDTKNGIGRTGKRSHTETRYEKMGTSFHERVRQGFLEIAKSCPERCIVINAANTIENVHKEIIIAIKNRLGVIL